MKNALLLLLLLSLANCRSSLRPLEYFSAFENMRWLSGSWEPDQQQTNMRETWTFENDSLLHHVSYLKGKDGVERPVDAGFIQMQDQQVYYTNDPMPGEPLLRWKLADCNCRRLRFHNAQAVQFQDIVFELTSDDRLHLTLISGENQQEIYYNRSSKALSSIW